MNSGIYDEDKKSRVVPGSLAPGSDKFFSMEATRKIMKEH